jgi:hypothetical protein
MKEKMFKEIKKRSKNYPDHLNKSGDLNKRIKQTRVMLIR